MPKDDMDLKTMGCTIQREKDLLAALMVYDVTLACLEPFVMEHMKALLSGQIKAAQDAYREVTGEDPLVLGKRLATRSTSQKPTL